MANGSVSLVNGHIDEVANDIEDIITEEVIKAIEDESVGETKC